MTDGEGKIFLPYLLVALARAGFEGRLKLMDGTVERVVLLRGGKPVNVLSNQQEETLGRILLDEGRLTREQYRALLEAMVKTGQRAGEALVVLGLVQPQEVFAALEFQCQRKLRNCFKMADFGFELKREAVPAEKVLSVMDISTAVLGGVRECYCMDRLLGEFAVDEETVFKRRQPSAGLGVRLGAAEQRLLNRIGRGCSLMKLQEMEGELAPLLARLYALHALETVEASGVRRPPLADLELGLQEALPAAEPAGELDISIDVDAEAREEQPATLTQVLQNGGVDSDLARLVLSLDRDDHFAILGLNRNATPQQAQDAFQKLVQRFKLQEIESNYRSPGVRDAARRLLDRATLAAKVLSDEALRGKYLVSLKGAAPVLADSARLRADVEAQKGEMAVSAKRYAEAMELFDKAIGLYPGEASYHLRLGLAGYFAALEETPAGEKLPDRVRKPFLKALALDPSHDEARLYLGYISKRNGEMERALKEFKSALSCNPKNDRARVEIRILEHQLGGRG